jgi:hypothetical protein
MHFEKTTFTILSNKSGGIFESVVTVAFQSVFHLKKYQDNIFLLLNFFFNINISKQFKKIK